jgi:HPt (histidine-containing phosphotransfer) domain-containing protein
MNSVAPSVAIQDLRAALSAAGVAEALPLLIAAFLQDAPPRLAEVERAVAEADTEAIRAAAHAFKSAAATMHATALATVLRSLEQAGNTSDLVAASRLLPEIRQHCVDAIACLEAVSEPGVEDA